MASNINSERWTAGKNQNSGDAFASSDRHGPILRQDASLLFSKPAQEIRDMIYERVFSQTRLNYGVTFKPRPEALALLRTCRRFKAEIGHRWLRHVLFNFEDPLIMMDTLTTLPPSALSEVRHVRVRAKPVRLHGGSDSELPYSTRPIHWASYYPLSYLMKLLPGLQLDVLTVLSHGTAPEINYATLSSLIRDSEGWRELRFLSCSSEMLGYSWSSDDMWRTMFWSLINSRDLSDWYIRRPQPAGWQRDLDLRDGPGSHPSVTVYRCRKTSGRLSRHASFMADPSNWEPYVQQHPGDDTEYGNARDQEIMSYVERHKEVLVIARRGEKVDYWADRYMHYLQNDLRAVAVGKSWKEIRRSECSGSDCILPVRRRVATWDDEESNEDQELTTAREQGAEEDGWSLSHVDEEQTPVGFDPFQERRVDEYEWTNQDYYQESERAGYLTYVDGSRDPR